MRLRGSKKISLERNKFMAAFTFQSLIELHCIKTFFFNISKVNDLRLSLTCQHRYVTWETSFDITRRHRSIFEGGEIVDIQHWFVIFKASIISTKDFTNFTQCWITIISEQQIFKSGLHSTCHRAMNLPSLTLDVQHKSRNRAPAAPRRVTVSHCRWHGSKVSLYESQISWQTVWKQFRYDCDGKRLTAVKVWRCPPRQCSFRGSSARHWATCPE
jgi:hypothetical protein